MNPQVLMAYAVLHEIAHLFLGPRHQPVGVMRGCWTSSEYLAMSTLDLGFTKREKETLRRSVLAAKVPASERLLSADEGSVRIRNK